jgi:hypothetical protein
MSEPKRGMVAGQPITTQPQTKEFDEGYDRIFPDRQKPRRGTFVYRDGVAIPVDEAPEAEARGQIIGFGKHYVHVKTTDGVDISSRTKLNAYLKATGLALADDFKKSGADARAERERFYQTGNKTLADKKARREQVGRSAYELSKRRRK